ncbi:MAG TPA: DUF1801 domain-containing protein [Thermoanaerobaculia bacterium]|jgi:hypothetical protein|nr:DUF1801 domain-containing protein [Thermoanaerobaculia bacterium]
MAELKTRRTDSSVQAHLEAIEDEQRRQDCMALTEVMRRVTNEEPRMWGSSIVGFGSYHYKYESGHEGDSCLVGFASRKGDISLYVMTGFESRERLLAELGKHKTGKACVYIKRLSDIKIPVLEELVADSVAHVRKQRAK